MLMNLLKNTKFNNEIKSFLKGKKEILDIILFGSVTKGKRKPKDIDILILFKEKVNENINYELRKKLEEKGFKTDIIGKTYKELFSVRFKPREDILSDGYSMALGEKLSEAFGYKSFVLFRYGLKNLTNSGRIRFYYALEGRAKQKGMIKSLNGIKFTNAVVLIPIQNSDEFENFLEYWNLEFKKTKILIPLNTIQFMKFNKM